MNEAEKYLEKKYKSGTAQKSSARPDVNPMLSNNPAGNEEGQVANAKSEKSWSLVIAVIGVIATICFMLLLKSCFAGF